VVKSVKHLADDEPADNGNAERASQLGTGSRAKSQRQRAQQSGGGGSS